nr:hypothetical protein [Solirubrobacterales bacterium]
DYRYFNLRDNRSTGTDLFDAVGLLFDDYRPKAAYAALRSGIERYGAPAAPAAARPATPSLRLTLRPTRVIRGRRTTVRVLVRTGDMRVRGARVRIGDRTVQTGADGRARLRLRLVGRPGARTARVTLRGHRRGAARLRVVRR